MLFQHVKQAMQGCRQGGLRALSPPRFFRKYNKALAYFFSYFIYFALYRCLVSSFGLLVSFQLVIGILQHFSLVLVSYKSLVFLLV